MKMRSIIVNELMVTDPVRYKDYQDQVPATLALFDGQYVSRGAPEPIVGEVPSPRWPGFTRRSSSAFSRSGTRRRPPGSIFCGANRVPAKDDIDGRRVSNMFDSP
jgi:hypothetical protein